MKNNRIPVGAVLSVLGVIALIIIVTLVIQRYMPSKEYVDLEEYFGVTQEDEAAIVLNDELLEQKAVLADGEVYIEITAVQELLNERFYWDTNENLLIYTTPTDVIKASAGSNEYRIGNKKETMDAIVVKADAQTAYVNLKFIEQYTNMQSELYTDPDRLVVTTDFGTVSQAAVKKESRLRVEDGIKSDILYVLAKGETVTILEELDGWSKVSFEGYIGYIQSKMLQAAEEVTLESDFEEPEYVFLQKDEPICLAWHQVTNQSANDYLASVLTGTKGINVISPTWFYVNSEDGSIGSYASSTYVTYAHNQGLDVWALCSNLVNTDVDMTEVLTHTSSRENLTNALVAAAIQYNLDGINIDFEELSGKVGDSFIQFIRELSIKCHKNDIVVSVDNYVPSAYTSFYDRTEQGIVADYVIIMGYDEHYVGGEAGSTASISWVSEAVTNTLKEVPAKKVILGIPFYTRLWKLTPTAGADEESQAYETSSSAIGMTEAQNYITNNAAEMSWDEELGQYYAEYTLDGCIYQIWLEDVRSIEKKLEVMKSNNLAGMAGWKLTLEDKTVWDTILKYVQ
jgi:spore germination protein YaaH